jgi:alkylresorcinol/alkylpyrone synthase
VTGQPAVPAPRRSPEGRLRSRPAPRAVRPAVVGMGHALPARYDQRDVWESFFAQHYAGVRAAEQIFVSSGVTSRHAVANPMHEDVSGWGTAARMERYLTEAMPLGKDAVAAALADAQQDPGEVGLFVVASCTGYATPGIDIRLARDLGMSDEVQRLFVGHMGCYAAIPALGAVADFVTARNRPAVLLCLELPTLHVQPATDEVDQVVAHALFADAAAAVVVRPTDPDAPASRAATTGAPEAATAAGAADPGSSAGSVGSAGPVNPAGAAGAVSSALAGFEVVDVVAQTDVGTAEYMTWDVTDTGFRMGLSPRVPAVLARHVRAVVDRLLGRNDLTDDDVDGWAVHPGGRRILEVVGRRLDLPERALEASYGVLRDHGNCSSATVLLVLARLRAAGAVAVGRHAVAMAFGPGLTLYAALLRAG